MVALTLVGLGGGALDASLNTTAALDTGTRTLNVVHACFAIGATVGPIALAVLLSVGGSWRLAYLLLFVVAGVLTVAFARARSTFTRDEPEQFGTPAAGHATASARLAVAVVVAIAIVYVGAEVAAGQWSSSLLGDRGVGPGMASLWVAGFWAALAGGRVLAALASPAAGGHDAPGEQPRSAAGGHAVVLVVAGGGHRQPRAAGGGARDGRRLPNTELIAITPSKVGAARAPAAIGLQVAGAALGAVAVPAAVGVLAVHAGLEVLGPVLVGSALALMGLHAVLERVALPPERPVVGSPVSTVVADAGAQRVERLAMRSSPPNCSLRPIGELLPRP